MTAKSFPNYPHKWALLDSDIKKQYLACKESVGVYDGSYIGRIKVTGVDALDLINRLSTNFVGGLNTGEGRTTVLTTDRGRIVDIVYVLNQGDHVLLITSPGLQRSVIDWLDKYTITEDIYLQDITSVTKMMVLVGPESHGAVEHVIGADTMKLREFQYLESCIAGADISIMTMPSDGLPGYYVLSAGETDTLFSSVPFSEITPFGHEVMDVLRIEAGIPVYPTEIGDAFNPLEAGLIGCIDFNKGCYIGQEVIARLDTYNKVKRSLVTLGSIGADPINKGDKLIYQGIEVGMVTSCARIPTNRRSIGLGYVRKQVASVGTSLSVLNGEEGGVTVTNIPLMFGSD